MKTRIKRLILDYLGITVGSAITALGLALFLIPNRIAAGGVSGLATIIYHLFELPVGMVFLIINIPIFIAGLKVLGLSFGARTIYGMITLALFIDIFQSLGTVITEDLLLASIYGGVVGGAGLGLVFYFKGSTGGTDLIARLINHFTGFSIGQGLLAADGFVVLLAGIFFNPEVALYAALTIFINSKTIDLVQEGINFKKAAFIISETAGEIKQGIISDLERGVTVLQGYGGYTNKEKDVLFCIITRPEVPRL
ncbi:MAG TPA: YitT family protein, partial [Halanaerobiales bacterium]|nr:YitT family protein [Halanaerobiales bacterium]